MLLFFVVFFCLFVCCPIYSSPIINSEHTTPENILRYFFVIYCFFGFIFFDLLYIAVIVTYSFQCQLIRIYIGTIMDKVLTKLQGYTLEQAMLEINKAYKFLQVVNGKLSALTSVCLLVFLEAAVSCEYCDISYNGDFSKGWIFLDCSDEHVLPKKVVAILIFHIRTHYTNDKEEV